MSEHKKARMRKNHFSNVCNIGFGAVMNGAYVFGAVYGAFGIYNGTMTVRNLYGDASAYQSDTESVCQYHRLSAEVFRDA